MAQDTPYVLIGNALSTMVAANRLTEAGEHVVIVNGSNNWGGHFTTVSCDGVSYDAGMVLHEFTSYSFASANEDLRTYNPAIRNDAGRFCNTVRQYVNLYQETHEVTNIKMYVEGKCYDDMLIANSLTVIQQLPFADSVKKELLKLLDQPSKSALHASNKLISDDFNQISYSLASLANHGDTFNTRLIEPFCKKLLNIGTEDVLARFHRVPWLPLFYPETLLSYLQGTPQQLPPTVFSYPIGECVGDLAHKLRAKIQGNRHINIINEHPKQLIVRDDGSYEISFNQHEKINAKNMAWSGGLGDLLKIIGLNTEVGSYEKCSFALVFLTIPTNAIKLDFTVLSIVDPEIMSYRITNQSRCSEFDLAHESGFDRLVIEINTDYLAENKSVNACLHGLATNFKDLAIAELVALGIIADGACVNIVKVLELKNTLPLPNVNNMQTYTKEMAAVLNAVPSMSLLGPASGFSSSSLNHQVLQGLKLYETWGK